MLELGFVHGRPRDLWRRVRFVIDQARAFTASASERSRGSSLRDFLAWAELQSSEGARVVETVLPETDDDAVRILTIHGAKGLEFPITIVSGTTTAARRRTAGVQLLFPHDSDTYALRVAARVTTEEFERYAPIDEQMDFHEKLRLLYVGLTRARDHLVVSVHRAARVARRRHDMDPRRAPVGCGRVSSGLDTVRGRSAHRRGSERHPRCTRRVESADRELGGVAPRARPAARRCRDTPRAVGDRHRTRGRRHGAA